MDFETSSVISLRSAIQYTCIPLAITAYVLYFKGQKSAWGHQNREFSSFQKLYFLPYFMALFSDWLQGPYVYKLYSYYGFAQKDIALLFVVGFASSITLGTVTGSIADKFGRKKMSIIFCLVYALCCLTKLSKNFNILLFGRILGGISTSILFSVFESWYVHQHTVVKKFPLDWMSVTFSKATFYNGLLAITAGLTAQVGSELTNFGPVAPFMIAIPFLFTGAVLISLNWEENYGERTKNCSGSFAEGLSTIMQNPSILSLGLVQSLFESNMYIFVFLWTPVLEPGGPPLGLTFSSFMIAIMIGSSLNSLLLNKGVQPQRILRLCLAIMGFSFLVCTINFFVAYIYIFYLGFLGLEISVGLYFPCIGRLRGEIIPDNLRANIMNWFRVPMNIITCGCLVGMHYFEHPNAIQYMFALCAISSAVGYKIAKYFSNKTSVRDNKAL